MRRSSNDSLLRRNPALSLVLRHAAIGALLGLAFVIALVALDAHGIGHLIASSDAGFAAIVLLAGGFMITFGSIVAGGAIMGIGAEAEPDEEGGRPVPVRVGARSRHSATVQRRQL
jgi:hypothetical protein